MNRATLVRTVSEEYTRLQELYRLDPPLEGSEYVLVSGVNNGYAHETYIFPADENGEITDWCELPGSFRGRIDIHEALRGAGYEVREGECELPHPRSARPEDWR